MKNRLSNIVRITCWSFFILIFASAVFLWWAVGEKLPRESMLEIESNKGIPAEYKNEILVASYNIGHAQGVKVHASDYRDKETTVRQLNEVAEVIKKLQADIYLLQEVDLDSKRTHHIDQMDFIKEATGYPFYACAMVWQKNYVPYPFWPPQHHIGYVRSANCILSKYRLSNQYRVIFDKPKNNAWWYNLGYLDRGLQRVDVEIGPQKIALINVHLEAWHNDTREDQIKVIKNYMNDINLPIILGGDFNTVMPFDPVKKGFIDDPGSDFTKEQTFTWLFANIPTLKAPKSTLEYSFPSNDPTRKLDHIFLLGDTLSFDMFRVVKEAKTASDHLPVVAKIRLVP